MQGKTAIVTGASGGIGRAIAERLAREGADVVVHYHRNKDGAEATARAIGENGGAGRVVLAAGDLAVEDDISALFHLAATEFGRVDIVVNNAGVVTGGPIEAMTADEFDRVMSVNLRGTFLSCRQAALQLADGGRLVNVSARIPAAAVPMLSVYAAAKAGVEALSRSLAHQLGPRGITVNAVAPGPTDTPMLDPGARANADAIAASTPLRRLGRPQDVASVVAFLAGDDGGWVTGQTLYTDGGIS
jgi:3-oxoacyl-[acyl-carrier protein] reductase